MRKTKNWIICYSTFIVLGLVCSMVLSNSFGSIRIIEQEDRLDFWGGLDFCGSTCPDGDCSKCCRHKLCYSAFEGGSSEDDCSDYTTKEACLGEYETVNTDSGYSTEYSSTQTSDKDVWGTCAKRYSCWWIEATGDCGMNPNVWYWRYSYNDCSAIPM